MEREWRIIHKLCFRLSDVSRIFLTDGCEPGLGAGSPFD